MKKFILILLPFLLSNCQSNSETERIYDEYLQLNQRYWSRVNNLGAYNLDNYFEGDSLTLTPELSFLMIPNDTVTEIVIEPENFFEILEPSQIVITKIFDHSFYRKAYEFRTINLDSNLLGHINSDDLIKNIEGLDAVIRNKDHLLGRVNLLEKEYNKRIEELANRYNIAVDSLYNLLAQEHFKATKEPIFTH